MPSISFRRRAGIIVSALAVAGILGAALVPAPIPTRAQSAPCGVVDAIDYPIDISDTLENRYDDFGLHRPRFGGNHTGIDLAFNRHGDPIHAAARGVVTYSDPLGWDTEKGVVIVEHTMPDGSIAYSLYGHMEQTDTIHFPPVGRCVELGDVVGVEGWPSRGLPHLHFEIRNFLPDDGGPGYVSDNPLLEGWYNPLDFIDTWRIRLQPGYVESVSYTDVPSLPPVLMNDGVTVIANTNVIAAFSRQGTRLWQVTTNGVITGIIGLSDNRVAAHTRDGQALTLRDGRFLGVWDVTGPDAPLVSLGDALVVVTDGGGLAAFTPTGDPLWTVAAEGSIIGVVDFSSNGQQVALALRVPGGVRWRLVDADGTVAYTTTFEHTPLIAPIMSGGWLALDGSALYHVSSDGDQRQIAVIEPAPGRAGRLTADLVGNAYVYLADTNSTLLSVSAIGQPRWRVRYPAAASALAPLLRTDDGCLLYALDDDGAFNVFNALDGSLLNQKQFYAGGIRNGSPRARLLQPLDAKHLLVSAGFLSAVVLDTDAISDNATQACILG